MVVSTRGSPEKPRQFPTFFFNVLVKLLLQVPFMLIRPFYAYFYAKQAVFCLSAHQDLFMLVRPFYAYQRTRSLLCLPGLSMLIRGQVAPNHAYQSKKKNEINLSRNDGFFGDGLSGSIFCSRQDDGWYLLDLPVLFTQGIWYGQKIELIRNQYILHT